VDLWRASPEDILNGTSTPVLLIHGMDDTNVYPAHSQTLATRNPRNVELWLAPGARHMTVHRTARWFADTPKW